MTPLAFLDIGFGEMVVVAFVALLLFGGRLPEVMRTLGSSYRNLKRGVDDLSRHALRPDLPSARYQPSRAPAPPPAPALASVAPATAATGPATGPAPFVAGPLPGGPLPDDAPLV